MQGNEQTKQNLQKMGDNDKNDWLIVLKMISGLILSAAFWIEETDR